MFLQIFSVVPGNTVDSKKIISFFLIYLEIVLKAEIIYFKSGRLFLFVGVGTVIIKKLHFFKSCFLFVIRDLFSSFSSFLLNSLFVSICANVCLKSPIIYIFYHYLLILVLMFLL